MEFAPGQYSKRKFNKNSHSCPHVATNIKDSGQSRCPLCTWGNYESSSIGSSNKLSIIASQQILQNYKAHGHGDITALAD